MMSLSDDDKWKYIIIDLFQNTCLLLLCSNRLMYWESKLLTKLFKGQTNSKLFFQVDVSSKNEWTNSTYY